MQEPELLTSRPGRRLSPAARNVLLTGLILAVVGAGIAVSRHHHGSPSATPPAARQAAPATPPATPLASTGRVPPAAPVAADLARVVASPARHRLRLTFTIFNRETTQVVLLSVGASSSGLALDGRSIQRFAPGGTWQPARLPLVLGAAQSGHVTLDYGVRRCPTSRGARLHVPAVLTNRERGRVAVDLTALVPPHDWPRGLVNLLCPISGR